MNRIDGNDRLWQVAEEARRRAEEAARARTTPAPPPAADPVRAARPAPEDRLERAPRFFGREIVLDGPVVEPAPIGSPVMEAPPAIVSPPIIPPGPRTDVLPRLSRPTTPRARLDADFDRQMLLMALGPAPSAVGVSGVVGSMASTVEAARLLVGVKRADWDQAAPAVLGTKLRAIAEKAGSIEARAARVMDTLSAVDTREARTLVGFKMAGGLLEKAAYKAAVARELSKLVPGEAERSRQRMAAARQELVNVGQHAGEAEAALRELAGSARETPWALQEVREIQRTAGSAQLELSHTESRGQMLAAMDAGEALLAEEPEAAAASSETTPGAEFEFTEEDLARIGTGLDPKKPAPQAHWSEQMVNTVCELGRQQGGVTDEQGGRNYELAKVVLGGSEGAGAKPLEAVDVAAVLKMAGVDLTKVDPNQLQSAAKYVSGATTLTEQQDKLRKTIENFQVLEKIGLPKLSRQQMVDELWGVAKVPGHALAKLSDADVSKKFQEVLGAVNAGPGKSEIKIGKHKLKLEVGENGTVTKSSCKKPSFFSKIVKITKIVTPIALTVLSFIPITAPFALAAQGAIAMVQAIKAKSILGIAAAAASLAGAAGPIISKVAGAASKAAAIAGRVAKVANSASKALQGISSLKSGNVIGGLASIGGAVASGMSSFSKATATGLGTTATKLDKFAGNLNKVSARMSAVGTGVASFQGYKRASQAVSEAKEALQQAQASGDGRAIAAAQKQLSQAETQKRSALIGGAAGAATAASAIVGSRDFFPGKSKADAPAQTRLESRLQFASRALGTAQSVAGKDYAGAAVSALSLGANVNSARKGGAQNRLNDVANMAQAGLGYYQAEKGRTGANRAVSDAQARLETAKRDGNSEVIRQAEADLKKAKGAAESALMGGIAAGESLLATARDIGARNRATAKQAPADPASKRLDEELAKARESTDAGQKTKEKLAALVNDTHGRVDIREGALVEHQKLAKADEELRKAADTRDPAKLQAARRAYDETAKSVGERLSDLSRAAKDPSSRPSASTGPPDLFSRRPREVGSVVVDANTRVWTLSQLHGVPVERIVEFNRESGNPIDPNRLKAGQQILIPLDAEERKFTPKKPEEVRAMQRAAVSARQTAQALGVSHLEPGDAQLFNDIGRKFQSGGLAAGVDSLTRLLQTGTPDQKAAARKWLGGIEQQHLQNVQLINTQKTQEINQAVTDGTLQSAAGFVNVPRGWMAMFGHDDNIRTIGNEKTQALLDTTLGISAVNQVHRQTGLTMFELGKMPTADLDETLRKANPQLGSAAIAGLRAQVLRALGNSDVSAVSKGNYAAGTFSWERGQARADTSFADGLLTTGAKQLGSTVRDARAHAEVMKGSSDFLTNFAGQFSAGVLDTVSTTNRFTLESIQYAQRYYASQGGVFGKVGGAATFAGSVLASTFTAPLTLADYRASDEERSRALVETALLLGTAGLIKAGAPAFKQIGAGASRAARRVAQTEFAAAAGARLAALGENVGAAAARIGSSRAAQALGEAGQVVVSTGRRAADALLDSSAGRLVRAANDRVLTPLAEQASRTAGTLGRAADIVKDYFSLVNNFGKGPVLTTGARVLEQTGLAELQAKHATEKAYAAIRNSTDDVATIAKATGRSEAEIAQIKNHLFQEKHGLADGVRRFDADPRIADAWGRLKAGAHSPQDLAFLQHEVEEAMLMKAGMSQKAAHAAAGVGRPLRSDVPLVFQGPPPGISPKGLHDEYVNWVRPGATERVFKTPWSASRGLGTRRFDDYNRFTRTGFEGNTTPWSQVTQEQLSRKLDQVASDMTLLKTNPKVKRIVWFGTEPLPMTGLGAQLREALKQAGIPYWVVRT